MQEILLSGLWRILEKSLRNLLLFPKFIVLKYSISQNQFCEINVIIIIDIIDHYELNIRKMY